MAHTALSRPPAQQLPSSPRLQTLQDFKGDFMKHVDDHIKLKNLRTQMVKCRTTKPKTLGDFDGDSFKFSKQL